MHYALLPPPSIPLYQPSCSAAPQPHALHLSIASQVAALVAAQGDQVVWVDTTNSFSPHRLLQLAQAQVCTEALRVVSDLHGAGRWVSELRGRTAKPLLSHWPHCHRASLATQHPLHPLDSPRILNP